MPGGDCPGVPRRAGRGHRSLLSGRSRPCDWGQAVQHGANVINISGGQLSPTGTAHPLLADAVRTCVDGGVLIVAAAGNEGCDCLHIPGALDSVLAVGAMDWEGVPLEFSNWGEAYQRQGILAPGVNIAGATPSGGTTTNSGTSYATAVVSGVAALLLSLQRKRGGNANAQSVRKGILASAIACEQQPAPDCRRVLAGRLNIKGVMSTIQQGDRTMSDSIEPQVEQQAQPSATCQADDATNESAATDVIASSSNANATPAAIATGTSATPNQEDRQPAAALATETPEVKPSACGCGCGGGPSQLVFALGQLGYDFGTEARRDSFNQAMKEGTSPHDPGALLDHLNENPSSAASIIWTLNLDATAVYAVQATGPFARETYDRLRQFLLEQIAEGVDRISVPGWVMGSARLLNGQVVPVIHPELRGMHSWTTQALVEAVVGPRDSEEDEGKAEGIRNFLQRVYHETRNLGLTPQDRALNFAATNAFNVAGIFESALKDDLDLDRIDVERSPICRPESDCWDVKLTFFNPRKVLEQARRVFRFTVDVSDVMPVTVGGVRSWFVR